MYSLHIKMFFGWLDNFLVKKYDHKVVKSTEFDRIYEYWYILSNIFVLSMDTLPQAEA